MINREALKRLADELKLSESVVEKVYLSYWKFIKESLKNLPDMDKTTKQEFDELRTNFNIPSIGKLYTSYKKVEKISKHRKIKLRKRHERNSE